MLVVGDQLERETFSSSLGSVNPHPSVEHLSDVISKFSKLDHSFESKNF